MFEFYKFQTINIVFYGTYINLHCMPWRQIWILQVSNNEYSLEELIPIYIACHALNHHPGQYSLNSIKCLIFKRNERILVTVELFFLCLKLIGYNSLPNYYSPCKTLHFTILCFMYVLYEFNNDILFYFECRKLMSSPMRLKKLTCHQKIYLNLKYHLNQHHYWNR